MRITTETIPFSRMNPAPYNPRVQFAPGDHEYDSLKKSIEEYGCVELIVWNKRSGNVVAGHRRMQVLTDMGETESAAVVVDLDDLSEKALSIALNQIGGRWDMDKLSAVLGELEGAGLAAMTGFKPRELEKIIGEAEQNIQAMGEINPDEFAPDTFEHQCPKCGFRY